MRSRILGIYLLLLGANLAAWAWALIVFRTHPVLLGTAFLAYSFGLRHAVDADHIAAIDNVTRKLMRARQGPVTVGFYFALGHSTVVILATAGIALTAAKLRAHFDAFKAVGGIVGTTISVLFLFTIAAANLVILAGVYRAFRQAQAGASSAESDLEPFLAQRGPLGRLFAPLFRMIGASWQMYPLGFLFGLGFDTATEIGLIGIAAAEATKGLSLWSILVFPSLFTAGMSLVDTTDGILMLGAYGWAFVKPVRKLYYNLTITFASVLVAVVIGGIEALGLIGDQLGLTGGFWEAIGMLNANFGSLGYLVIILFVTSWLISLLIYRIKGYDRIEAR